METLHAAPQRDTGVVQHRGDGHGPQPFWLKPLVLELAMCVVARDAGFVGRALRVAIDEALMVDRREGVGGVAKVEACASLEEVMDFTR